MAAPLALRFVRSYADADALSSAQAEIALAGRSNVGKSSLINALANRKGLARTSKTPGATRLLNAFELLPEGSGRILMDLPGYGYAKAPRAEQARWGQLATRYVEHRQPLVAVLHLIDGQVGPTRSDLEAAEWLRSLERPVCFVATKADKLKSSKRQGRRNDICERLGVGVGDLAWTSAASGTGIPELRSRILKLLGCSRHQNGR